MKLLSLLIFLMFISIITSSCDLGKQNTPQKTNIAFAVKSGDLIFRRGCSVESHIVLATDHKSNFSHVGIIYIENEMPFVIHAVPGENKRGKDYIKKEKLADFLLPEKASEYSVYRSDFSETVNETASRIAYNFYKEKRLFDEKYDLTTNDKLYCTELILKVYQQASNQALKLKTTHINILFGTMDLIMPGNIIENSHFHSIINN